MLDNECISFSPQEFSLCQATDTPIRAFEPLYFKRPATIGEKLAVNSSSSGDATMANRKAVALTDQELKRMANAKFAQAAALSPAPEQQKILISASGLCVGRTQLACKRFASAEVNGGESARRGWRLP